jgi:hypothetical protein
MPACPANSAHAILLILDEIDLAAGHLLSSSCHVNFQGCTRTAEPGQQSASLKRIFASERMQMVGAADIEDTWKARDLARRVPSGFAL